jgi:ABC-type phosphate transport system substrate-binding protein
MKYIRLILGLLFALLPAGALHAGPLTGAVVIANESTPVDQISPASLKNLYTGRMNYWDGGQRVVIVVLADKTDQALSELTGMDPSQFRTFWQRLVFSGRGEEPRKAMDVGALVTAVASTRGAIALAPADAPLKGVKIVEVK